MLEFITKYAIKIIPIMFLNIFPPKYSDTSIISLPGKALTTWQAMMFDEDEAQSVRVIYILLFRVGVYL